MIAACADVSAQTSGEPVAGPPVAPQRLTDLEPRDPYRQLVPGLLIRTRYVDDRSGRHAVELWDLLVGPGKTSENARLPGAAVVEVRSGTGTLNATGNARELRIGSTVMLEEGTEFSVANSDKDGPLILRVTVIRSMPH